MTPADVALRKEAYRLMRNALRRGALVRKTECEDCGQSHRPIIDPINAHHHKGYQPEFALDVVWICRRCHRWRHAHNGARWGRAMPPHVREAARIVTDWFATAEGES